MTHSQSPKSPVSDDDSLTRIIPQQKNQSYSAFSPATEQPLTKNFGDNLTVQGIVGEGGGGRVYLVYDESIGRHVAVKEICHHADNYRALSTLEREEQKKSFIHEAKITGKLEHPSIVPIYELGSGTDDEPYYVMRYIKGETLEERLDKTQKTYAKAAFNKRMKLLDTLVDVCDAVAYAHSKGVIHRDLKPSNIISGKFGETLILDWGLAQALDDGDDTYFFRHVQAHQADTYSDTASTLGVGTIRYMAPEQLKGKAAKVSDVYSLGVILFKIITGSLPYKGNNQAIQTQLLNNKPSPTPNHYMGVNAPELADMSPELGAICEKAMAKNPNDRFADAAELARQLKDYRDGRMVNIYSYSKQELFRRFIAKNKISVVMIIALFISITAGGAFSVHYAMEMKDAREKAEEALISVTALGETAQEQATNITQTIDANMQELFTDMKITAGQIDALTIHKTESEAKLLKILHQEYPKFTTFKIDGNAAIPATLGWKFGVHKIDAPIASIEKGRLSLTFIVPLKEGKQIRYLMAKVFPETVISSFFPIEIDSKHPKDIWIMQEDGVIIFDVDQQYRGTNLFINDVNRHSQSVIAFGNQVLEKSQGISYYSFIENNQKIFKIAAWQTLEFPQAKSWKIIVNYIYMTSDKH